MSDRNKYRDLVVQAKEKGLLGQKTLSSLQWFRKKISTAFGSRIAPEKMQDYDEEKDFFVNHGMDEGLKRGWMYSFVYRAKYADQLPYWDAFPLILMLNKTNGGFIGLNFHYLYPEDRAYFMNELWDYQKDAPMDEVAFINIKYSILMENPRLKYYKPCIKRYLYKHVGNFLAPIYPYEWPSAIFLPTENFKKAKKEDVWKDSKTQYRKR